MYDPSKYWDNCRIFCANCGRLIYGSRDKYGKMKKTCDRCHTTIIRKDTKNEKGEQLVNLLLVPPKGATLIE